MMAESASSMVGWWDFAKVECWAAWMEEMWGKRTVLYEDEV